MLAETSPHAPLAITSTLSASGSIAGAMHLTIGSVMAASGTVFTFPQIVQQVSGSNSSGLGMGTSPVNLTREGNFLVAFVGWDTINTSVNLTNPPNPGPAVPAVNITDSDGNMWQQLGITVVQGFPSRCAIWGCANANPAKWISVALTGFAASIAWTFAEITNMPQAISVDFSSGDTTTPLSVSQLSLVGSATNPGSDVVFTMLALPTTSTVNPAITSAPSGMTALNTSAGGASSGSGIAIYPYWEPFVTQGTITAAYSTDTSDVMTGIIVGISAQAQPPQQANLDFPLVIVEAAFGAQAGDITKSVDYLVDNEGIFWTDISTRVIGNAQDGRLSCSRGRQYELAQEEAGELTVWLNNLDGAFTPGNSGSPYYSNALNANMSMENGVPPWTPVNNTQLAASNTFSYTGTGSVQVTPDGVSSSPGMLSELVDVSGIIGRIGAQQAASQVFATSGNWIAPAGIGSVSVECWGAGGGGGGSDATAASAGGGGGGGEYAQDTVTVTPGNTYPYVVGNPGSGGNGSGTENIVVTYFSSTLWTAPAGVTTVTIQAWGGGGSGAGASGGNGGGGGGGGEYASQASIAVTPGNSYNINVGGPGGNTSFAGNSVTVTAHGGHNASGINAGAGGSGSTNSTHFAGGTGGAGNTFASGTSGSGNFDGGSGGSSASNPLAIPPDLNFNGAGITSVAITAGGAGGGGAGGGNSGGGGGGGGGGYASGNIAVVPGGNYTAYAGNGGTSGGSGGTGGPGGDSHITGSSGTITAGGGAGGVHSGGGGGSGSTAGSSGGSGASGQGGGGGGGGGGKNNGTGGNASGQSGGSGGGDGGGGGNGATTSSNAGSGGPFNGSVGGGGFQTTGWSAPAGVTSINVYAGGGGGGGEGGGAFSAGYGGGGGGGGGYGEGSGMPVTPGNNYTFQYGNGGNRGTSGQPGGNGGSSGVTTDGGANMGGGGGFPGHGAGTPGAGGAANSYGGGRSVTGSSGGNGHVAVTGQGMGGGGGGGGGGSHNGTGGDAGTSGPRNPGSGGGNGGGGGWGSSSNGAGNNTGGSGGGDSTNNGGAGGGGGGGANTNTSGATGGNGGGGFIYWTYSSSTQNTDQTPGSDGSSNSGVAGGGGGGGGGAQNSSAGASGGNGGAGWIAYSYSNTLNTPIGGGGGGSADPSGAGNAGATSTDVTAGGAGGVALANGGGGGNGGIPSTSAQAGSIPGGGGGGSTTGSGAAGGAGQLILSYTTTTSVSSGTSGTSTTFNATSVVGHGGAGGTSGTAGGKGTGGAGGSGSANSVHFSGGSGAGGVVATGYGGGGGGSGGTSSAGNNGTTTSGGSPVSGGAGGGNGALLTGTGLAVAPVVPSVAGGAGGGGAQNATFTAGAAGAPGQVRITYTPGGTVSASAWFYTPAGWPAGAQVNITWFDSTQSPLGTTAGPVTPVPAGQWTQVLNANITAPVGTAFAQISPQFTGVPASVFYVDEAALVPGSAPVQTGLVRLLTPIRVSAWWRGVQYPVWFGYVERFPMEWPDLPQWGMSQVTATDAVSVAAAVKMYSAMQGEIVADNPYAYIPCNEQYTTAIEGPITFFSLIDANGLIALNYAPDNQTPGIYADGLISAAFTGEAVNLLGDANTGMGTTAYQVQDSGNRGPGMFYYDPGLPVNNNSGSGLTIEFWFLYDGTTEQCTMLTIYGPPSTYKAPVGSGNGALGYVLLNGTTSQVTVAGPGNAKLVFPFTPSATLPNQVVLVMTPSNGNVNVYFNGVLQGTVTMGIASQMFAISLGPGRYTYDAANAFSYQAFNYTAAHLAVYAYQLTPERISSHYNTGIFGGQGVSAAQRFQQILSWGHIGLKRGMFWWQGVQPQGRPEITRMGPAYSLAGSTAADAIAQTEKDEGGRGYAQANGSYVYTERWGGYNKTPVQVFGDTPQPSTGPLITPRTFGGGLGNWTATNAALVTIPSPVYYDTASAALTPAGGFSTAFMSSGTFSVNPGVSYTADTWIQSGTGWILQLGCDWFDITGSYLSTSTVSVSISSLAWLHASGTVVAPSNARQAQMRISLGNNPAPANYLLVSLATVYATTPEIPYQETAFDFDNSHTYNEVQTTQQNGPNTLVTDDVRNIPSVQLYFRRSALSFTSNALSPYDVADLTTWSLAKYGLPQVHIKSLNINCAGSPQLTFANVLHLDLGDVVTVIRRPIGGVPITETCVIERIQHNIGPAFWTIDFQLSPYVADSAIQMVDGTNNIPGNEGMGW